MSNIQIIPIFEYDGLGIMLKHEPWKDKPWFAIYTIWHEEDVYTEGREFTSKDTAVNYLKYIKKVVDV